MKIIKWICPTILKTESLSSYVNYTLSCSNVLSATPAKRKESVFNEVKYVELYYYMHLKRKTLYYGLNWIIPSILISLSNVMGFTMPPECGEKITLRKSN